MHFGCRAPEEDRFGLAHTYAEPHEMLIKLAMISVGSDVLAY